MSKHLRPRNADMAVYVVILFFFIALGWILYAVSTSVAGVPYSQGERVGIITKLSKKGLFCKTWEGEMNFGGFKNQTTTDSEGRSSTAMVANIFEFSVTDPQVAADVQEAMNEGQTVGLTYDQFLIHNPCTSSTGYLITGVRQ